MCRCNFRGSATLCAEAGLLQQDSFTAQFVVISWQAGIALLGTLKRFMCFVEEMLLAIKWIVYEDFE
jgi:hypothetical protein